MPDNTRLICIAPLVWHRRQLHRLEPEKGGTMDGKLSLHDPQTGRRLTQSAQADVCKPIKLLRWKTRLLPLSPAT